jgi:hypothetical protein
MKYSINKILFALCLTAFTSSAFAGGTTQSAAGCGVGTEIFKDHEGLVYSLLATTTNGLLFGTISQTFGLVNCPASASIKGKIANFIDFNKQQLAMEVAQGHGERLAALVEMYGVTDQQAAANALKSHHGEIFSQASAAAIEEQMEKALNISLS